MTVDVFWLVVCGLSVLNIVIACEDGDALQSISKHNTAAVCYQSIELFSVYFERLLNAIRTAFFVEQL